ncbi:MAG TPA: hypothetical protein VKK31_13465 [Thermoanaerobaculia bacterium]|nr:hypothetical protein [Thermoanaerobaculia bacterium]
MVYIGRLSAAYLFIACSLGAQATPPVSTNGAPASAESAQASDKSPFDFTFGPQENGNFGTTLKGSKFYSLSNIGPNSAAATRKLLVSPFIGVSVDAGWNSASDAANNASFSVRPSLGLSSVREGKSGEPPRMVGPWLHAYVDLRERYGNFKQEDSTVQRINQTMGGLGVEFRYSGFDEQFNLSSRTGKIDEPPRLSLTYYTVRGTSVEEAALPDELKADVIQLDLKASLTIPRLQCTVKIVQSSDDEEEVFGPGKSISCPWSFSVDLLGTKPTSGTQRKGEVLYDLALSYDVEGSIKPVLHYRSGKEHGLEYDRQLILGILMKLFP